MNRRETDHFVRNLFSDFKFVADEILVGTSHNEIKTELSKLVDHMYKVRNSELHWIRTIETDVVGSGNKRYYIPLSIISDSFLGYYLKELGHYYVNQKFPNEKIGVRIRPDTELHLNMWMNFYEKGNATSSHTHVGDLSGIIFCSTNKNALPTTFENGANVFGNFGDMCLFPSGLRHENRIYMGDDDRITISYNMDLQRHDKE